MKKKIINIAHRGFTKRFPDNTLDAFRAALELGVDGIEFDVQETADGEFIVFHDDAIDGKPITEMSSSEVWGKLLKGKYKIPSLEETLKLLGHKLILLIELKQVKAVDKVISLVRSYTDINQVVLSSFSRKLVSEAAELAPDIMSAVIADFAMESDTEQSSTRHPSAIGMRCQNLDADTIDRLHMVGTMVFVWDCTGASSVKQALKFDIDGLISDAPDVVQSAMGKSAG
jgi:glycerophosphoryl diester phosphodiesterase